MPYLPGCFPNRLLLAISLLLSAATVCPIPPRLLTVHVFLSTECPISQQYVRELSVLQERYKRKGVAFSAWFPLRTDSPRVIRGFQRTYALSFAGKPDSAAQLARQYQVRATPEVVVVGAGGQVRYRGAIDDCYVSLGKHRSAPTQHYLRDALDALLTNRPVLQVRTEAVGCLIE